VLDMEQSLEELVSESIEKHSTLSELLNDVLSQIPEENHFREIGRIVRLVGEQANSQIAKEKKWTQLDTAIEVEDWMIKGRKNDI
jgi:hypothetical protein